MVENMDAYPDALGSDGKREKAVTRTVVSDSEYCWIVDVSWEMTAG